MSLTASEVASLTRSLSAWETAEYIFAGLVTLGCLGEFASEFTDWFTGGIEAKKNLLAKCSTLLLVGSLALELVCLVETNQLSGQIIGSLDERATEASEKSQIALTKSENAITHAGVAEASSTRAGEKSDRADKSASTALTIAQGARQEADSFERDIVSAKKQAAEAEAHLAEALQRATEASRAAEAERLARLKIEERLATPRIDDERRRLILAELTGCKGRTVVLGMMNGNRHTDIFRDDLVATLVAAGMTIDRRGSGMAIGGERQQFISITFGNEAMPCVSSLIKGLVKHAVVVSTDFEGVIDTDPKNGNRFEIVLGPKLP